MYLPKTGANLLKWPVFNYQHCFWGIINRLKPIQCMEVRNRSLLCSQYIVGALVIIAWVFSVLLIGMKLLRIKCKYLIFYINSNYSGAGGQGF